MPRGVWRSKCFLMSWFKWTRLRAVCNSKSELCSEIGRSAFVASYGGLLNSYASPHFASHDFADPPARGGFQFEEDDMAAKPNEMEACLCGAVPYL